MASAEEEMDETQVWSLPPVWPQQQQQDQQPLRRFRPHKPRSLLLPSQQKLQGRKISAPSFAASLRPLRNGSCATPPPRPSQPKPPSSPGASASPSSSRLSFCTQSCSSTPAECRRRRHSSSASSDNAAADRAGEHAASPGPVFFFCGASSDPHTSSSSLLNTPVAQITSLEEASGFIEELRAKLRAQGQQVIAYRRKLRQQRSEMSEVRQSHRRQLEDIAAKLLYFESSLRTKEKGLQETLATKDQVIAQQKRIIRKLLKKCYGKSVLAARESEQEILVVAAQRIRPAIAITAQADYDTQNDSDSAVILEDNLHEVSLVIPCGDVASDSTETRVCRSISDVVKASSEQKQWQQNKAKEERRISNRQKLLALKRHSGHLKRPEILETVYSVEEDGELQQQQLQQQQLQQQQQQQQQQQAKPSLVSRGSALLQNRFDSDLTASDADYSTDDDSTRLFFSETATDASGTTSCCCSQSCSRRSSCAVQGFCSSPCSRRSSWGGDAQRRPVLADSVDSETDSKSFNRIMGTNHRAVTKPRDIKFKRISKAKSRSLEELRGRLRAPLKSSSEEASDV